jgi:CheY-like chemotaxis protein
MRFRAIVFEDDDSARQLLVTILERRNYEVISAKYPTICPVYEDLTTLCPHEFACGDFLLTDNNMPVLSGLDFVLLQNQRGCKGVINNKAVLSAHWNDNELDSADQLGCKVFKKPYRVAEIDTWLDVQEKNIPKNRKLDDLKGLSQSGE